MLLKTSEYSHVKINMKMLSNIIRIIFYYLICNAIEDNSHTWWGHDFVMRIY
jgi:hypothetical protein